MKLQLTTNLKASGRRYRAGEVIDPEEARLDEVQVASLLQSGSALPFTPQAQVVEESELARTREALEAANAANAELRRELSSLRAQVEKQKPLASETDSYRKRLAREQEKKAKTQAEKPAAPKAEAKDAEGDGE